MNLHEKNLEEPHLLSNSYSKVETPHNHREGSEGMVLPGAGGIALLAGGEPDGALASEHPSISAERLTFFLARDSIRPWYMIICEAYSGPAALFMRLRIWSACSQFSAHNACRSSVLRSVGWVWDKPGRAAASWTNPIDATRMVVVKPLSFIAFTFLSRTPTPKVELPEGHRI